MVLILFDSTFDHGTPDHETGEEEEHTLCVAHALSVAIVCQWDADVSIPVFVRACLIQYQQSALVSP